MNIVVITSKSADNSSHLNHATHRSLEHRALLESELQEIFSNAPQAPSAVLNEQLVKAYGRAVGNKNAEASSSSSDTRRKAVDGEDCSVCFEAMEGKTEAHLSSITFCSTCGKGLHTHCFRMCKEILLGFHINAKLFLLQGPVRLQASHVYTAGHLGRRMVRSHLK